MRSGAAVKTPGSEAIQVRRYMPEKTRYDFESLSTTWQTAAGRAGTFWCDLMHDSPMWPIHGQYECRTCGRRYPVQWDGGGTSLMRQTPSPSVKFVELPLVVILAMLLPANIHGADAPIVTSNNGAEMVFARYIACQTHTPPGNLGAIEIDTSLLAPGLQAGPTQVVGPR